MKKGTEIILAFAFGVVFVTVILILAIWIKTPTAFQYEVFRIILALAAGGVAAVIPGISGINAKSSPVVSTSGLCRIAL